VIVYAIRCDCCGAETQERVPAGWAVAVTRHYCPRPACQDAAAARHPRAALTIVGRTGALEPESTGARRDG
jgi:hypothetical protein